MLERRGDVAGLYDRWSATYDEDRNRTRDLAAGALRRSGLDVDGRLVVEPGCGTGRNTAWLARRARRVVGLDLSPGMLARARERVDADRVGLLRHDLTEPLPLASASVDTVVVALVLEHLDSVVPLLTESARVLRPRGELLICEYHPFRQLTGGQARFRPRGEGEEVRIPAHVHTVEEHVAGGLDAGLRLIGLREWFDPDNASKRCPRILSLRWRKP